MTNTEMNLPAVLVSDTRNPSMLAVSYEVVTATTGLSQVTWVDNEGGACASPPFPNRKLACEWASDHLYLCGG